MLGSTPGQQSGALSIDQMQDSMINVAFNVCFIVTVPVEIFLRPFFGTLFIPAPIAFFSGMMMIIVPLFGDMASGVARMIPFASVSPPSGLISLGAYSRLFFMGMMFFHGPRLWRRMLNMQREKVATFEGPPYFFFRLLPGGKSYFVTRIILEPCFLFVFAYILGNLFVFQNGLTSYLEVAAFMLSFKNFLGWYLGWRFLRQLMDQQNTAPIIAKIIQGTATDDDLAPVHLASLPKDLPSSIRQSFSTRLSSVFSVETPDMAAPPAGAHFAKPAAGTQEAL